MHNVLIVAVVEGHQDHLESLGGQLLVKEFVFHDAVEKFSALA